MIRILGWGVVGGFGAGRRALLEAASRGSVPPGRLHAGTHEIPAFRADASGLGAHVPKRALRRVDTISRFALLAAFEALEAGGLHAGEAPATGLVYASGFGPVGATQGLLESILEGGDALASPIDFASSLHNATTAHLSMLLGLEGPCVTLSQGRCSLHAALSTAALWIGEGRAYRVLVAVAEELTDFMGQAWLRSPGPPPGEGGAAFLLGKEGLGNGACLREVRVERGPAPWAEETTVEASRVSQLWGDSPLVPAFEVALALSQGGAHQMLTTDSCGTWGLVEVF